MLVYRIEHEWKNYGPYREQCSISGKMADKHSDDRRRPTPFNEMSWDDYKLVMGHGLIFGCKSIEALIDWFDEFLEPLFKLDFVIKEFDIEPSNAIITESQVAFSRPDKSKIKVIRFD